MTALAPEQQEPGRFRVQDAPARTAAWFRRQPARLRARIADTRDALVKPKAALLSGKNIRYRFIQSLYWSSLLGFAAAQVMFGIYDAALQVPWWPGHSLKAAWDATCFGLVHSGNWPLYRHLAYRDVAGPALATMVVVTLLSKRKWWDKGKNVSTLRIAAAPLVVIIATYALGTLGVYLGYFGLPDAWHHLFGSYTLPYTKWLGYLSATNFAIAFAIAHILRRFWAPVGAALQGGGLDRSVDYWQRLATRQGLSKAQAVEQGLIPAWERYPIAPPPLRERFAEMYHSNKRLDVRASRKRAAVAVLVIAFLLAVLGTLGHYVAGHGIPVPYLFPGH